VSLDNVDGVLNHLVTKFVVAGAAWCLLVIDHHKGFGAIEVLIIPIWIAYSYYFMFTGTFSSKAARRLTPVKHLLPVQNRTDTVLNFVAAISQLLGAFALTYHLASLGHPSAFSEPLSRVDALYFTLTVFTTTGFGDITAQSQFTRLVVSGEMISAVLVTLLFVGNLLQRWSIPRVPKP
jgi:hypothetical protein